MTEQQIEDYVIEFFRKPESQGGLGYRELTANVVGDNLIVPSLLGEFISTQAPEQWKELLRQYHQNKAQLLADVAAAVEKRFIEAQNVATFINNNKTFTFENQTLPLYNVSFSSLKADADAELDFQKNIFGIVRQSSHKIKYKDVELGTIRPDLMFYLNGVFFGYMELKTLLTGQTAKDHGRDKIARDYMSAIGEIVKIKSQDARVEDEKKRILAIFEKGIHITTSDINETYVVRNIGSLYDSASAEIANNFSPNSATLNAKVREIFKPYPLTSAALGEEDRFAEVMHALYSKKMIEKEILYYNFLEYNYKFDSHGALVKTGHRGKLIAPRPKQKFGCDKIMARVKEMLDHEAIPNYYENKLRKELKKNNIPSDEIEKIIVKRNQYLNNKYVYSLLLQYAAGFGKSNIIGWTALQLSNLRYDNAYVFDKVMLVVDRLQLRGQLDTMMYNMNIDNSLFVEARDKATFINALSSAKRIIVVNIQKFRDLKDALDESGTRLAAMRVAFLIDEIHRSNAGSTHDAMINLFVDLQQVYGDANNPHVKKNLLVGLTATPSDDTLERFGEYQQVPFSKPLWMPFDTYSMQEAIDDGFILDPTKHIIPYAVPVDVELPPDMIEEIEDGEIDNEEKVKKVKLIKSKIYAFEPRMRKIAEFVVDRLVSLVYTKIHGEGKAMLAVSSVPNAIAYCNIIREIYSQKCSSGKYAKYKDAPISIVYSDNQTDAKSDSMNYGVSEDKVIQNFKNAKNGLIIVVDKLQTGFDEPKLHTLFLDKEIRDINAIQTISRVNRTCKYKTECHVIDCSYLNVNPYLIKTAFKKFCNMVISTKSPDELVQLIVDNYRTLTVSEPYAEQYSDYFEKNEDQAFMSGLEDYMRQWIKTHFDREQAIINYNKENNLKNGDAGYQLPINEAKNLRLVVGQYGSAIEDIKHVYQIAEKYTDTLFLGFWDLFCKVFRTVAKDYAKDNDSTQFIISDSPEVPGITLIDDEGDDPTDNNSRGHRATTSGQTKETTLSQVLEMLQRIKGEIKMNADAAQVWLKEIGKMYEELKTDNSLMATLKDPQVSDDDKFADYKKAQNKYRIKFKKNNPNWEYIERFTQLLKDNVQQLYDAFMINLPNVIGDVSDYDFTVPEGLQLPENASAKDWIEAVKKFLCPQYSEAELKKLLENKYANCFDNIKDNLPEITVHKVIEAMFAILSTPSRARTEGLYKKLSDALHKLFRSKNLDINDKREKLETLLNMYEVYLKKIFYLHSGQEIPGDSEDKEAALANSIYQFKCLRNLKYAPETSTFYEFKQRLDYLKMLRNKNVHDCYALADNQVDAAVNICVVMYLYVTAFRIFWMNMAGITDISCGLIKDPYFKRETD